MTVVRGKARYRMAGRLRASIHVDGGDEQVIEFIGGCLDACTELSVIAQDLDGTILLWNEGARRAYGYEPSEVVGRANIDILNLPGDVARAGSRARREAARRDGKWEGMVERVRKDGRRVTERVVVMPRRGAGGQAIGYLVISRDLAAESGMEELLNASPRFAHGIVGSARDAINLVVNVLDSSTEYSVIGKDLDGQIVLWNEGARRIYGYEAGEVVGKANTDILHAPESLAADLPRRMREAALRDGKWEGLVRRRRRNGETFTARVVLTPRHDPDGKPIGFLLISKDTTEEARVQQELERARQTLGGLVDSAMDAIVTIDEQQRITLFNPAAERMFGFTQAQIEGQPLDRLLPSGARDKHRGHVRTFGATGVTSRRMGELSALSGIRSNGEEFPLEASISKHESGGRRYFTAILRDITERKKAEDDLLHLQADLERRVAERTAELQAANEELEAFDYSISHDLRAPINRIDGFCAILSEEYGTRLDERARDLLGRISRSGRSMGALIDDLLKLATATRKELRRSDVDLGAVAAAILEAMRNDDPGRDVAWHVAPGLVARADAGLMRVVLDNLLRNAWKFTSRRTGAVIEVGAAEIAGLRTFHVRDNGVGFNAEQAGRIFTPFERLHSRDEFEGTGIGLAIVQRIVHRHGGRVWAEGAPGAGACIRFTLPA